MCQECSKSKGKGREFSFHSLRYESAEVGDRVDFDPNPLGECGDLHSGASGRGGIKVTTVGVVDLFKVTEVD